MPTNTRDISPDMVLANYSSCEDQEIRYEFSPAEIAEMKSEFFRIAADKNLKEELAAGIKAILAEDHDNHMGEIYNLLRMAEEGISSTGTKRLAADFKDLMTKISSDRQVEFWLESVEMHEAVVIAQNTLINTEIELFSSAGITVIEK